jgi:deoxynucleoside triphosphate triphosphohydrolase SAMHD1
MTKYVLDKIHGTIKLYPLALQIIDTCEFQRLRKIKQLGNAHYIFPGATHSRFEHSIGVYHLSGLLIENIKSNQINLNITDRDILLIKVAALCHDLGHGCFSHLFDSHFLSLILADGEKEKFIHHEYRSEYIFKFIANKYHFDITINEVDFICDLINSNSIRTTLLNRPKFMYEIVANCSSGLDCDKIDYLIRDTQSIGMNTSFDYGKMFQCARVIDDTICYPDDEALNIYQLFHSRFIMHKKVYQHKKIKEIDYMILDILLNIDEELQISNNIDNVDKFILYTDNILDIIQFTTQNEHVLSLLKRIDNRQLYQCIYTSVNDCQMLNVKLLNFIDFINENDIASDVIINNSTINFSMKHKNPVNEIYFYNSKDENTKFKIDKSNISLLLPTVFQEINTFIILKNNKTIVLEDDEISYKQACINFLM